MAKRKIFTEVNVYWDGRGEKKYLVRRGFANHVDNCPINKRVFQGKSYANITDDCLYCEYRLALSENYGRYDFPEQFLICGGKEEIKRGNDNLRISFDREEYINKLKQSGKKEIYTCINCGYIGTGNPATCDECDEDTITHIE